MFRIFIFFCLIFFYNNILLSKEKKIILASTTSTYDSGLLKYLNDIFKIEFNIDVQVLSQGTGQALRTAIDGNVEVVLVHHKKSELDFMKKGYGLIRHKLMFNDYIIVGPKKDTEDCVNVNIKLNEIFNKKLKFISRGDDSGTHKKEIELLKASNINYKEFKSSYLSVGQGMGNTLLMANEMFAYTLSDRGTWVSFNKKDNLKIICESQPPLLNQYGVIIVNPKINSKLDIYSAKKYVNWLISDQGKKLINDFKVKNQQLFFFNYN